MISHEYLTRHLRALVSLLRKEETWDREVDDSSGGVFNSAWAIILSVPLSVCGYLIVADLQHLIPDTMGEIKAFPLEIGIFVNLSGFLLSWFAGLILLGLFTSQSPARERLSLMLVTYNWSILLLQMISFLILYLVSLLQQYEVLLILVLCQLVFWGYLRWLMIRRILGVGGWLTFAILVTLFIVSGMVDVVVLSLGESMEAIVQ